MRMRALIAVVCVMALARTSEGAWAVVASTGNSSGIEGAYSVSSTMTLVNVNDLLVLSGTFCSNPVPTVTLTSSCSNSCTKVGQFGSATLASPTCVLVAWYCSQISNTGSCSFTATGNQISNWRSFYAVEYSGNLKSGDALDTSIANGGDNDSANPLVGSNMTTTVNGDLLYAHADQSADAGTLTAGSGFTVHGSNTNNCGTAEWGTAGSAGTNNLTYANSTTGFSWGMYSLAFKPEMSTGSMLSIRGSKVSVLGGRIRVQ